ncbi:MAG: hypothetical protein ABSA97_03890 [Verrucomicrobiia bacterium]
MRIFVVSSLLLGLVFLFPVGAFAQVTNSPVGTWAVALTGSDHGLTYLSFSNNFTWGGYGISLKSFGLFTIDGSTWSYNQKLKVASGYTQLLPNDVEAGHITVTLPGGNKLRGRAVASNGHFNLKGQPSSPAPHISGSWIGEVQTRGTKFFETYTITASTNMAGWFDIAGEGIDSIGPFTASGAVIVHADRRANGYTISDYGTSVTTTSSFSGRFNSPLTKITFAGKDDNNHHVIIRAAKQ